jgi:hypothetical protein
MKINDHNGHSSGDRKRSDKDKSKKEDRSLTRHEKDTKKVKE